MNFDRNDFLYLFGAVLLSYGAGMIYLPAGLIAGGILLIVSGFLGAMAKASRK